MDRRQKSGSTKISSAVWNRLRQKGSERNRDVNVNLIFQISPKLFEVDFDFRCSVDHSSLSFLILFSVLCHNSILFMFRPHKFFKCPSIFFCPSILGIWCHHDNNNDQRLTMKIWTIGIQCTEHTNSNTRTHWSQLTTKTI